MLKQRQRIDIIRGEDSGEGYLGEIQGYSKSKSLSNLMDLISDVDKLVEIGYSEYLSYIKNKLLETELLLSDVTHLKHLYRLEDSKLEKIETLEKKYYIDRNHYKIEVLFVESNEKIVQSLIFSFQKINNFNEVKNSREYKIKLLNMEEL